MSFSGLGFVFLNLALAFSALEAKPDEGTVSPDRINKLIEQLGSSQFKEREEATKALEAIGSPALEPLQKAIKSSDVEIQRRAEGLVQKINKRLENDKILAPQWIHLQLDATPVEEAVAILAKKSGYAIQLAGDKSKWVGRRVTLDTGEVTFWEAFDQLCQKAGLVEAGSRVGVPNPSGSPVLPGKVIQSQRNSAGPKPPEGKGQIAAQAIPGKFKPAVVREDGDQPPAPNPRNPADQGVPPAPAVPVPPKPGKPVPAALPPAKIAPVQIQIQPLPAINPGNGPVPGSVSQLANENKIILVDGKFENLPTCYQGAVRIRALPAGLKIPGVSNKAAEILLGLEVSPEPKVQIQRIVDLFVEKAIDNQDQTLVQAQALATNQGGGKELPKSANAKIPFLGNLKQLPVFLKTGSKPSETLKELKGRITAQASTAPEEILKIDNLLKAVNQEVKGPNNSRMKLLEANRDAQGNLSIRVQVEYPTASIIPFRANQKPEMVAGPLPGVAPSARSAGSIKYQSFAGLTLIDDKEQPCDVFVKQSTAQVVNTVYTFEFTFTCQPRKGQGDPVKMVFIGSRVVTVEIPFTLKNVPVPQS